jgi:acetylornithine/succinyldiaminopimelate/putrescine aminotransferase
VKATTRARRVVAEDRREDVEVPPHPCTHDRRRCACAHNYHPLPVVIARRAGAWVTDVAGHRYLDCLAGYSALNFGHRHPALVDAAHAQLDRVTLVSRAFHHDQFGPFCAELAALTGKDMVCR